MKIGDKVYSSWFSLDINDIDEYVIIGIEDDTIIVPNKVYSTNEKIKLSKIDKKLSCFFTTHEKAVDNILHNIQKNIKRAIRLKNYGRLEFYLDKEKKFMEDIKSKF